MQDSGSRSSAVDAQAAALVKLTGDSAGFADVIKLLDLAGVADFEIQQAQQQHPEHAALLRRAFLACTPTGFLAYDPRVYRAHVRELLDRVIDGLDLAPGTDAEVLAVLVQASLRAPLGQQAATLYERLFARVLPEQYARAFPAGASSL